MTTQISYIDRDEAIALAREQSVQKDPPAADFGPEFPASPVSELLELMSMAKRSLALAQAQLEAIEQTISDFPNR